MIHIYYGDGKGKTTAAVGLAIRSAGNSNNILFTQFFKGDTSGERRIMECIPNITLPELPEKVKFIFDLSPEEHREYRTKVLNLFDLIVENINKYDMIVADEIFSAVDVGFITLSDILALIKKCPDTTELVLTGHNVDKSILTYADYVTYMSKIKHPYDTGVRARRGIEF